VNHIMEKKNHNMMVKVRGSQIFSKI